MSAPYLRAGEDSLRLAVQVQPKASRNEIAGPQGDRLKVRLTAPPVEGQANKALVRFLAKRLGVARSGVVITGGYKSRRKEVSIRGLSEAEALARLG